MRLNDASRAHSTIERMLSCPTADLIPDSTPISPRMPDDAVLEKARSFQNSGKLQRLLDGDIADYPSHSEADASFCAILAFVTRHADQIDRLMRASKLMRPKWDEKRGESTYGCRTIERALSFVTLSHRAGSHPPPMQPEGRCLDDEPPMADQPNARVLEAPSNRHVHRQEAPAPPNEQFALTDMGNAERLARDHGMDIRYIKATSTWMVHDGLRWRDDETCDIERRAKRTVRSIYGEAERCGDDAQRKRIATHARSSESHSRVKAMISLAPSEPDIAVLRSKFDTDKWKLNVLNGTIDLMTGRLLAHNRADFISKLAPVRYDREVAAPRWEMFLREIMRDNDQLTGFVQRACGYALSGSVEEQCLFFLYGDGANGKSTFLNVLLRILGDYSALAPPGLLIAKSGQSHPTEFATLNGRRFVVCQEVDQGRSFAEVTVKQMTGGDRVTARRMHEDFWEFDPTHKLFFAANHRPRIRGTDNGIWRRIYMIPFDVAIPKERQDLRLIDHLSAESSGILNWALDGCSEWLSHGLRPPTEVENATREYRSDEDVLGAWLAECTIADPSGEATTTRLFESYAAYMRQRGEEPLKPHAFGKALTQRDFANHRTGTARYRKGIRLRPSKDGAAGDCDPHNDSR